MATAYKGQIHDQAIINIAFNRLYPPKQDEKPITYAELTTKQQQTVQTNAYDLALSTLFIANSDRRRYGRLSEELENDFTRGRDDYPHDLVQAFRLLNEYKNWNPRQVIPETSGVAFAQKGKQGRPVEDWHKDVLCHHCQEKGHIKPNCPQLLENDVAITPITPTPTSTITPKDKTKTPKVTFAQHGIEADEIEDDEEANFGFCTTNLQTVKKLNLKNMVLLDNQSTVDLFCNRALVTRVWSTGKKTMTVCGNGGTLTTNKKAYIHNYGDVWFHEHAITNILALKNVLKQYRVTYDSGLNGCFTIHKGCQGTDMEFKMHKDGLHYHDTGGHELSFIQTVKETSEGYSQRQIAQAKMAREFQAKVGHPSTADLKAILKTNQISNCPITPQDVERAEVIFGPSVPILKGKTTRHTPLPVVSDYIAVPENILKANQHIALSADIFSVNNNPFFTTISEHLQFTTSNIYRHVNGHNS